MRNKFGVYALLAAMPLFFSTNLVIGRAATPLVEPWTLSFWRWAIAALIVLPFTLGEIVNQWPRFRALAGDIFLFGFLGMVVCGGGVYVSLQWTTATNATLIYTASALVIVLLDLIYFGKRLTPMRAIGMALGFLGVAVIVLRGDLARLLSLEFNPGDLGMTVCAVAWAIYSILLKRKRFAGLPTLPLFALIAVAGTLLSAPPMLYEAIAFDAVPRGVRAWILIAALAVIPGVLAFVVYQFGVAQVGPSITGVFLYLIPVYGVLLATTLLGEQFYAFHAAGLLLVVLGVTLATDPFRRPEAPA